MTGPTYGEIVDMLRHMPRRPRFELHIHPSVMAPLRENCPPPTSAFLDLAGAGLLFSGIPVIEHEDYPKGMWELRRDGEVVDFGFITTASEEPHEAA